jgi:hypothetical protein
VGLASGSLDVVTIGGLSRAKVGAGGPADDEPVVVDDEGNVKLKFLLDDCAVSGVGVNPLLGADSLDLESGELKNPSKLGGGVGMAGSGKEGLNGDGEGEDSGALEGTKGPGSCSCAGGTLFMEELRRELVKCLSQTF